MKAPRASLEPLSGDEELVRFDLDAPDTGAIFWSEENGFVLKLPDEVETADLPTPLFILGLFFFRLKYDDDFIADMVAWSKRKPH
jgi:hypothetical protein